MKQKEQGKGSWTDIQIESGRSRISTGVLLVLLIVLGAYANSFTASWHMDDYPNILNNPAVQMTDWDRASLLRAVGIDQIQGNNLSRPVANLSFALNWYLHGTNVTGYHLFNVMIHVFNAGLVYWIVLLIGTTPLFPDRHRVHIHLIALGTCLLWALNPVQTQAVTYIVQRMTSLSAFFYLSALISYLKFRLTPHTRKKILWAIVGSIAFLLALGSKENAITLPLAVVLMELIFFQETPEEILSRRWAVVVITGILITGFFVVGFFFWTDRDIVAMLTKSYDLRPFSLMERVITQPRVVIFYLSLLFYPIPQRLSLEHDFAVSTSLLQPWSTLPAILMIGLLITFGFLQVRRRPLLAFVVLFFFLHHTVESTFLPLEMVFEHRNYLPSVFLFLPISAGWLDLKRVVSTRNRNLTYLLQVFPLLLILFLAAGTYARNMDWQSERSLWADTHRKAPGRARPVFNLAKDLERRGNYEQAIALYRQSMSLQPPRLKHFEIMALTNIGTIFYKSGDTDKAIAYYLKALDILPDTVRSRYNLAVAYSMTGEFQQAEDHLRWLLEENPDDERALDLMGLVLLKQQRLEASLKFSRRLLQLAPGSRSANLQIGAAFTQMALPAKGYWFLRRAYRSEAGDLLVMLCTLENRLASRDRTSAERIRDDILKRHPFGAISPVLNSVNEISHPEKVVAYLESYIHNMGKRDNIRFQQ